MVQIPNRRGSVDTPHLFCPVEDGSNPGGDRDAPNDPNPPFFWAGRREREKERERGQSTVGKEQRGATGEREQERTRENGRERVGERLAEQETGANRRKGRVVGSSSPGCMGRQDSTKQSSGEKQGAVAPQSHRLDTSSRVERLKHDRGCESAAHVRQLDSSGQGQVDSKRMNGVERKS